MTQAQLGNTVQVHYTGRLDDDTVFGTSTQDTPLEFTVGAGEIIPGFEQAVVGMQVGDNKTVLIPAGEAYGMPQPERVVRMPRQDMPADLQLKVGQRLQLQQPGGQVIEVSVVEVTDVHVVLDANHPLAGEDLTFEIMLVAIVELPQDE
jgi:peptidylprolyl isomerase